MVRKIAVITGTTHGIGQVTARELAAAGFEVIALNRNPAAQGSIRCDLASLESVRESARAVLTQVDQITLLVNNAGITSTRHRMSRDGFELNFATNYLGPYLLTRLLLDQIAPQGRIINVASCAHYKARWNLNTVRDARASYSPTQAYAQSKLANVMHTFALARRLAGTDITANCLHPGVVATNLLPRWVQALKRLYSRQMFDSERGARTTLHLALAPEIAQISGKYFDENQLEQPVSTLAADVALQEELWSLSESWTQPPKSPTATFDSAATPAT